MNIENLPERATNGKKLPTEKEKAFAAAYIQNKRNGTKAALQVYNTTDPKTAGGIAIDNLAKPRVQTEIQKILNKGGLDLMYITQYHKRNIEQFDDLVVSQKAVETGYKLHGFLDAEEKSAKTNIGIIIEK